MSSYGSFGNRAFYGNASNGSLQPNGSTTYNPSLGSLGSNVSRTRVNNRDVRQEVPMGPVIPPELLGSPNHSMVNNGIVPPPPAMNQNIPQDLIQRAGMNCDAIVREAYQRGYQDAQIALQGGKKKRSIKKKKTTRKRSTSRK
jgi:hypothetical protein